MKSDNKQIINDIISSAGLDGLIAKNGYESWHVTELDQNLSDDKSSQLRASFELFSELVSAYTDRSKRMMAMLVISFIEDNSIRPHKLQEVINDGIVLSQPPEIYLMSRDAHMEPYIVEEYKLPLEQTEVSSTSGTIYAYYRCHRNNPNEEYSHGIYFEHYPIVESIDK